LPRQQNPELWAALQNELANSLTQNPLGDRADNLEQAIHHYQLALEVRTREAMPSDHRLTQRNLGNLYFGERRWAEALEAYQAAIAAGERPAGRRPIRKRANELR
jgi:tetratricopeptide (TPR) repeat protein